MQIVRRHRPEGPVKISFILLDWSCRESFHMLEYLAEQTVPREEYEILWLEYYDRRPAELVQRMELAEAEGRPNPVDTHVLLEMPRSAYYHKHLMYNVGLVLAAGEIVCICDSDTMVSPTFVESILREFAADPNIVLHHDEVRNHDRGFHPFRYPPLEDVRGPGSSMMIDRRPVGMWDTTDPLHTRNYGACLSARRADLLAIGGADMHVDYLGHVCGPYEMTFRLVNAGRREVWHATEFLYHTWHPGEAGDNNYFGPHDGLSMSTTALAARETGRIQPLEENPAITRLRGNRSLAPDGPPPEYPIEAAISEEERLRLAINPAWLTEWDIGRLTTRERSRSVGWGEIKMRESAVQRSPSPASTQRTGRRPFGRPFGLVSRIRAVPVLLGLFWRQWHCRKHAPLPPDERLNPSDTAKRFWLSKLWFQSGEFSRFLRQMWAYNRHLLKQCWFHLAYLADAGIRECVLYGEGDAARMLLSLSRLGAVRIRAVCPVDSRANPLRGVETWDDRQLRECPLPIVVAAFVNVDRHVSRLAARGVPRERLVLMQ